MTRQPIVTALFLVRTVDAALQPDAIEAQLAAALARCASGDRSALRVIYDLESGRMVGIAQRMLRRRDLAEDAVHDAFMRIWRGARGFDPARGSARSWLYAVVRNRALTMLRDESRFNDGLDEESLELDTAVAMERLPEASALRRCLETLEPKPRNAVVLAYVHGLSHGELAGKLGVPLGTAKSWTRRGLLSLQECMG
jgi:RNA polymerase sigma factor (sigma-70 family)